VQVTLLQQQTKDLLEKVEDLKHARRKVLVLCGRPLSGKTALAKEVCQQLNATYVDASVELLPGITSPVLGAYGPDDFLKWIKGEASRGRILCVDEVEPLVVTFGEQGARDFFQLLGSIEPKQPTIVVTRLEEPLRNARFPDNRIFWL
jgi:SpoVK/Ycf46/Vps4 family AAA+-type ATPase